MAKKKCQVEDSERLNGAANCIEKIELPNTSNVEVEVTPPKESSEPVQNGNLAHGAEAADTQATEAGAQDGEEDQPLSLAWPANHRKKLVYLAVLPIVFPLWITLPDVRNPSSRKFFPLTFFGSIAWIAVFSYLMVWWAHQDSVYELAAQPNSEEGSGLSPLPATGTGHRKGKQQHAEFAVASAVVQGAVETFP
ncbi:sodium/potassium/calcium exchanger 2-like [Rhinatrema bivittatum]|uniref:sodium/potassium/calcium exchanger 2-like n=1 Tax=Rhinatrema bivittatum TaxID=194408 RepID=UPI00112D4724|nr:sodium/potassium/calcium exchanger 2-like [Rhinatrema bivittatum]